MLQHRRIGTSRRPLRIRQTPDRIYTQTVDPATHFDNRPQDPEPRKQTDGKA